MVDSPMAALGKFWCVCLGKTLVDAGLIFVFLTLVVGDMNAIIVNNVHM